MKKVLSSTLLFIFSCSLQAQLSGVYTINDALPSRKSNFSTLSEALYALSYEELASDVVFELSPGFYNQALVLDGVDSELDFTVTFTNTSEEPVQFVNDGLSVLLNNCEDIIISNIKFSAISTEMSSMLELSNSSNVTIANNEFMVGEMSAHHHSVLKISNSSHHNEITDNTLRGVSGLEITRLSNYNKFNNNEVYCTNTGLSVLSSLNTEVVGNLVQAMGVSTQHGIVIDGAVGEMKIASNTILGVREGISQNVTYRPAKNKFSGEIVNNIIEATNVAIDLNNNVSELQIAFNSFIVLEGRVLSLNEKISGTMTNVSLYANNLINQKDAQYLIEASINVIYSTDFNNLYNEEGSFLVKIGKDEIVSINEWKTKMQATNAISANPLLVKDGGKKYTLLEDSPCIEAGPDAKVIGMIKESDAKVKALKSTVIQG